MKNIFLIVLITCMYSKNIFADIKRCDLPLALHVVWPGDETYSPSKNGGISPSPDCRFLGTIMNAANIKDCQIIAEKNRFACFQTIPGSYYNNKPPYGKVHVQACWACIK